MIQERAVVGQIQGQARITRTPRQHSETLACWPPVRPHGIAWLVRPYPRSQIVELIPTRENRREADNTAVGRVRASQQALHKRLVADLTLARPDHVAFIEHDQPDVVDQARIASQREVEFLRRRYDDLPRSERVLVTSREAAGAVERRHAESERREGLTKRSFCLSRERSQQRKPMFCKVGIDGRADRRGIFRQNATASH